VVKSWPGLERKQRSLLRISKSRVAFSKEVIGSRDHCLADIGMLMALESWPELGVHVRDAINNGLAEMKI
jgi:alkylhydroperoxidase/carboxymuconolactone decarboxylase family protein YurZ